MAEPIRLAKRVAALAACSRREAELYIEAGWVSVDGAIVDEPQTRVADAQRVELDPRATLAGLEPVTLLLHQPPGLTPEDARRLLAPEHRAAGDPWSLRPVKRHFAHLTALLPLAAQASGLAVWSQQRGVIRRLTEDAALLEQEVVAQVEGTPAPGALERLARGGPGEALKVSWQSEQRLRFAIKGLAAERLPLLCQEVGLRVLRLKRLRIGRIPLAGLPEGTWRYLRRDERF